jgi:DNA polymerase III alpha subunit
MKLKGRATDAWGNVVFNTDGLIDHLMKGKELASDMTADPVDGVIKFNGLCQELDHPEDQVGIYEAPTVSVEQSDLEHQAKWFIPEPYASIDVQEWLLMKCQTEAEVIRILEEFALFEERDMLPMLRCLIYLVASFREEGIVWGVGRGSSVASYALYLIGIHKVNSLAFDLDVREFLK